MSNIDRDFLEDMNARKVLMKELVLVYEFDWKVINPVVQSIIELY